MLKTMWCTKIRWFMFIGKHPAQYFDIFIVTPLVLESSTSVPVCRHEIPNTVASWMCFRGSSCQTHSLLLTTITPQTLNQVTKKSPSQARSVTRLLTRILYGVLVAEFKFSCFEMTPRQPRYHRVRIQWLFTHGILASVVFGKLDILS